MTKSDQIKILNDKIKVNNVQYDINRLNAEISAYSSGDLDKYEFLTKQDLKYKPDALKEAKFAYSPLGKVFNDGLNKEDETKKVGILQRLKNIEDNLNSNDVCDNDNSNKKVGIFQIIKDIKDKGIKISNDNEAIREIREHIQNLRNKGVRVNNFDEITREIKDHIQNLKDESIDVNINNDQVNDLVNKTLKGIDEKISTLKVFAPQDSQDLQDSKDLRDSQDLQIPGPEVLDMKDFYKKYKNKTIRTSYKDSGTKYHIDTLDINNDINDFNNKIIDDDVFKRKYNTFIDNFNAFERQQEKKSSTAIGSKQKKLLEYGKNLKRIYENMFPTSSGSQSGKGLKILTPQQIFTRLPMLLAQIKAGNNSEKLKNEIRQLLYSLYRSKQISKTIYKNLIATI